MRLSLKNFYFVQRLIAKGLGNCLLDNLCSEKKCIIFLTLFHLLNVMWSCIPSNSFQVHEMHFRGFPWLPF